MINIKKQLLSLVVAITGTAVLSVLLPAGMVDAQHSVFYDPAITPPYGSPSFDIPPLQPPSSTCYMPPCPQTMHVFRYASQSIHYKYSQMKKATMAFHYL